MKILIFLLLPVLFLISCSKDQQINKLFRIYSGKNPGASLMVIKDGIPVLIKSFGMANIEKEIPVVPETNFRLASLTKQFTAMAIMLMIQDGKICLDDKLKDIFPDFPDYGKNISIRHLLQHTSGLIDYETLIPDTATKQVSDRDVLNLMMGVDSTYFQPGTQHRYSNSAYAVLVMILEKLSGISFSEFLKTNIFIPLQMTNTVAFTEGKNEVSHRALGYHIEKEAILFSDQSPTSAVLGDGGIYSSVYDLYKWDQALNTNTLLSKDWFLEYVKPGLEGYGFGWHIDTYKGKYRMSHTGSTCGFRNVIQRYPDDNLTIILLTNRREPDIEPLADRIAEIFFNLQSGK